MIIQVQIAFARKMFRTRVGGDGMFPGMNPRDMQRVLKQLGIQPEELDVQSVVITLRSGERLVFDDASVMRIRVQGQETYQLVGTPRVVEAVVEIRPEDVRLVMEEAGVSEDEARRALEAVKGDIAAAILRAQGVDE